jgi:hypothetical protein
MQPYSKYPCKDKLELTIEEERVRQFLKADLNSHCCGTGCSTVKERSKQYYEEHKDERKEYNKQYYEENKDELSEQKKQYYEENKDELSEKMKQYHKEHKDEINEKNRQKVTCECGCIVTRKALSTHRRSKKHINFMEKLNH